MLVNFELCIWQDFTQSLYQGSQPVAGAIIPLILDMPGPYLEEIQAIHKRVGEYQLIIPPRLLGH